MKEIILPREESSTGGSPLEGYAKYALPEGLKVKDEMKLYWDFLGKLSGKQQELANNIENTSKEIDSYKKELEKQRSNSIEIIGVFSAILAFTIIDVNIVKSAPNFLAAILLMSGITASLLIFASLIHKLFSTNNEHSEINNKSFLGGVIILIVLIIFGIVIHIMGWNLYEEKMLSTPHPPEQTTDKTPQQE